MDREELEEIAVPKLVTLSLRTGMNQTWLRVVIFRGLSIAVLLIVVVLIIAGIQYVIKTNGWGVTDKTLYDWLDVLIFPLVIAIAVAAAAYWLDSRQRKRDREAEARQRDRDQRLEEQRRQDAALQGYLGQMSQLLLSQDLRNSGEDDEVRAIARSRTEIALSSFDAQHKGGVVRFLHEANLINKKNPIVRLGGAGLFGSIAKGATDLKGLDLTFTYLGEANLSGVELSHAKLAFAMMSGADLSETQLYKTDLSNADLTNADLRYAVASAADFSNAFLNGANLEGVNLWDCSLREADLSGANLQNAELAGSIAAAITGESYQDADLTGADLTEANLRDTSITEQQLAQCKSIKGAVMPDGSKHD